MPATGTTFSGSATISAIVCAWSRITLIGQQPSPTASAALHEAREHDGGIDRRIEEQIEMVVRERLAAHRRELRRAAAVGEEDEEHRRLDEPWHFRKQRGDGMALSFVANNQNIALLQIALCRRR